MALFWIKSFHSFVFIVESLAILFILYSGLFNVGGPWLAVALILVLAEIAVFVANRQRCPLTKLALKLGDKTRLATITLRIFCFLIGSSPLSRPSAAHSHSLAFSLWGCVS